MTRPALLLVAVAACQPLPHMRVGCVPRAAGAV